MNPDPKVTNLDRPETVRAEQAIFTSVRSPMGEGYRLVASTPGITPEERAEITRRSPSHGSLCESGPGAFALSSYPLAGGRQCIAWTRLAGKEHTARGGQRVHTHLVVLEPPGFHAFDADPFRVHASMRTVLGETPDLKPQQRMDLLMLEVSGRGDGPPAAVGREDLEHACRVAAELVPHDAMVVAGGYSPMELGLWTLAIMPRSFRLDLSLSVNLHYAAARQTRLTWVDRNTPDLQRLLHGRNVHLCDLASGTPADAVGLGCWFEFVIERWKQGRLGEVCSLADQLDGKIDEPTLARIVSVIRDAEVVERAGQGALEELVAHYADLQPLHPLEARLTREMISAAVRRAAVLQHDQVVPHAARPHGPTDSPSMRPGCSIR